MDFDLFWEELTEELSKKGTELGFKFNANNVHFDDSRAWSLFVIGERINLDVYKFGAYRNYLGGGMRSGICHNGREKDNTIELGQLFADALERVEGFINQDYEEAEEWEKPTGALL